jgi:signal transduction histidine kinase
MKSLWVRLFLMISGVLLLVFLLQFIEIKTTGRPDETFRRPSNAEIAHRLYRFIGLSMLIGLAGGFAIGRVMSSPITALANATREVEAGKLQVRVPVHGSREFKELASAFNKMAAALQHAETARNNFMADVSHELRTPLTVLEGNLRAALDHIQKLDEAGIANLYTQTRHLIRLVNELHELALAETGQLKMDKTTIDIQVLVNETLQALEPLAAERNVELAENIGDLPPMQLDPVRMRQVLFNLLTNALRHTPTCGKIRVTGAHSTSGVTIVVEDTGEGFERDELEKLFNRFYRVDKSRSRETGGTGLGLSIAKAIIEAHGGSIIAYSAGKNQGSRFTIVLPEEVYSKLAASRNSAS